MTGQHAHEQHGHRRGADELGARADRHGRPHVGATPRVEISPEHQQEPSPLDEHQEDESPPERIAPAEAVDRKLADVDGWRGHGCSSSSSLFGPYGQNHPIKQMAPHAAPSGAPHGVKMSTMKPTPVASASSSGHTDGPGT